MFVNTEISAFGEWQQNDFLRAPLCARQMLIMHEYMAFYKYLIVNRL